MIIRKKFRFEGAHIVRNCTSHRCRENIHGHSYEVEVLLKPDQPDNGIAATDFLLSGAVPEFIHSFDHAFTLWDKEGDEVKEAVYRINARVAEIPVSPSAEGFALLFFFVIDRILAAARLVDRVQNLKLSAVRIHETHSGYAESSAEDLNLVGFSLKDVKFNQGISREWNDPSWWVQMAGF